MLWSLAGPPAAPGAESPVRCVPTGQDGWARVAWGAGGYRIDGLVRAVLVDAGGARWRIVVDRSPELAPVNCAAA